MGHYFIVGSDVELDEATKGSKTIQRMEVEPSVLQGTPERLDHRIRKGDLDLGQDARQRLAVEKAINGSVHVLAARVRDHDRVLGTILQLKNGFT